MIGPDTSGVYKVTYVDIDTCAKSLLSAFSEDKGMLSIAGGKNVSRRMYDFYKFIVRASLKYGHVYASSKEIEGIVIWLPEGVTYLSAFDFFTNGGIGMILRHGFEMPLKMMRYEDFTAERHHSHIKEPHWYLLAVGVVPEHRKKGITSRLLRPFFRYFDENRIPCYLETGEGNNEAMYRYYGFDLVEEVNRDMGVFKAMIREPESS